MLGSSSDAMTRLPDSAAASPTLPTCSCSLEVTLSRLHCATTEHNVSPASSVSPSVGVSRAVSMKSRHSRACAAGENRAVLVGNLHAHSRRCVRPTTYDGGRVALWLVPHPFRCLVRQAYAENKKRNGICEHKREVRNKLASVKCKKTTPHAHRRK